VARPKKEIRGADSEAWYVAEQIAFISLGVLFDVALYSLLFGAINQVNEIIEKTRGGL
jgi:hypothetical protein